MKNADVYRIARDEWGDWLKSAGFKRGGSARLAFPKAGLWVKPLAEPFPRSAELLVGIEAGKYGWDELLGGRFTLNLSAGQQLRFWWLLNDTERSTVKKRNLEVLDRLPPFEPTDELRASIASSLANHELWLYYVDEGDLRNWLELLRAWLPDLLARLADDPDVKAEFPE